MNDNLDEWGPELIDPIIMMYIQQIHDGKVGNVRMQIENLEMNIYNHYKKRIALMLKEPDYSKYRQRLSNLLNAYF